MFSMLLLFLLLFFLGGNNENSDWVEDEEQTVRLKANYVISTFRSGLTDTEVSKTRR